MKQKKPARAVSRKDKGKAKKSPIKNNPISRKKSALQGTKGPKTTKSKRQLSKNNSPPKKAKKKTKKFELRGAALKLHNKAGHLHYKPKDASSDWSGNSDDEGSVLSGVLEENLCFECGQSTMDDEKNKIVLCDRCDGEYHIACQGLDRVPRITWKCKDCVIEEKLYCASDYKLEGMFKIPRKRGTPPPEICYSPSRPLELAWNECMQKGFMVVKKVFSHDLMRKLTHGLVQKTTRSGRTAETWIGAVNLLSQRLGDTCHNIVNRDGRFDVRIPDYVIAELGIEEKLQEIANKLCTIMSTSSPPRFRTHDVIMAPVGSAAQPWHVDDAVRMGKKHRYFTILIHLNPIDSMCGGTEVWSKSLNRGDMIRGRPGDAFIFNGTLLHRGQANYGSIHRFFYYASFSCKADENAE